MRCTTIVKSGDCLIVVTPRRRTSSGNFGKACETRFCTCTCALSTSVPNANVTVRVMTPSPVAWENIYNEFSTPLTACSNGAATVSEIVLGLAPGYVAITTMVGGTISGYSLIGNRNIDIKPSRKIIIDNTPAKIGRLMKKCEKFMAVSCRF
ncbi:hypothetical protein Cflav_PD1705 [Pedosphaera parvula Ellin514]|uniref:Uncharacterized protein n=1 Tax=Pedosphaera parvula (strain Ellin514) TaxID=320771 RepID=B9XMU7_PEDPL|nr:hypothetical protein Cflav_PD1705 [Pedosphaera parvula Ellin514]